MNDKGPATLGSQHHSARTRRVLLRLAHVVLSCGAVALVGFVSSAITRRPSEEITRRHLEMVYRAVLPNAPQLTWRDPGPLATASWRQTFKSDLTWYYSPVRYRLFAPKYVYAPRDRSLVTPSKDRPFVANGYVVTRVPLPFVVRVHYGWIFTMWDQQTHERLGVRHGAMDLGVVTYLALFGVPIEIDHYPMLGWTW